MRKLYTVRLLRYVPELVEVECFATSETKAAAQAVRASRATDPSLYCERFDAQIYIDAPVKIIRASVDVTPID